MDNLVSTLGVLDDTIAAQMKEKSKMKYCCLGLRLDFHAIGQGLFASGELLARNSCMHRGHGDYPLLRWVYDCGSETPTLLSNEIEHYIDRQPENEPTIDLVAISHFDKDHISGIVELLSKTHVKILLLPYIPLHIRLIAGFDSEISPDDPDFGFFINPVQYIRNNPVFQVDDIVLVPGSEGRADGPDGPTPNGVGPDGITPEEIGPLRVDYDKGEPGDQDLARLTSDGANLLRVGGTISNRIWEFVPYNDKSLIGKVSQAFIQTVTDLREELLNSAIESDREKALKKLKKEYLDCFGKETRNLISLHLYGGLIGSQPLCLRKRCRRCSQSSLVHVCNLADKTNTSSWFPRQKTGILYTGDGYLDTVDRVSYLKGYLTPARWRNFICLQVMHHGSKYNWQSGLAKELDPECSVFSSNPFRKYWFHPHAEVFRDFMLHRPLSANKRDRVVLRTCFCEPPSSS